MRAAGSPKPGIGRPQYVSSRNAARFSTATCSRHATRRGQARHADDLGLQRGQLAGAHPASPRRPHGVQRVARRARVAVGERGPVEAAAAARSRRRRWPAGRGRRWPASPGSPSSGSSGWRTCTRTARPAAAPGHVGEDLDRPDEVVDRHAARDGVERGVVERQARIGVEVVHDDRRGVAGCGPARRRSCRARSAAPAARSKCDTHDDIRSSTSPVSPSSVYSRPTSAIAAVVDVGDQPQRLVERRRPARRRSGRRTRPGTAAADGRGRVRPIHGRRQ